MKTYSRKKQISGCEFDTIPMDFNEICRLCMSVEGEKFQIFEDVGELPLPLRIMACVSVEVFEGDGLPGQVCQQCLEELERHYEFKLKCESSDAKLKQYLKSGKALQYQPKPSETSSLKHVEELGSTAAIDLLTEGTQEEQDIINNLRNDLESPDKRIHVVSEVFSQEDYKESTKENETVDMEPAQTYTELSTKPPETKTSLLPVKQEHADQSGTMSSRNNSSEAQQPMIGMGVIPPIDQMESLFSPRLPFACTKCPKRFVKRIDLRRHESVHNQQRGFECPVCEKWFPNKTSFGRHERTHTGERPYSCDQCGKSFSQGAILARHIMTHTGIKPFKCEICGKGFTQREGLRVHMRQHTKEQPEIQLHECPLCEKSFCHPSGLSRHLLIHTGKTFDCTMCPKVFTDSSSLRRHMKRHGDIEQPLNQPPQDHDHNT